jgi:hypothetical protein
MDLIITYPLLYILFIYFSFTSFPTCIREPCTNVFNTFVSCVNGNAYVYVVTMRFVEL